MTQNRLIHEKSPYLLQHAHNPVDWHPWSEEAFRRAEAEDKPVFLSIGYATCHWCHVMERESFEDPEAARHLNDTFICIKVDREERPDIDAVYMTVCHMLTGSGGWPLNLILTPKKQPFFAGTYIPRTSRFGRPGLIDICRRIDSLWGSDREKLIASAADISGALSDAFKFSPAEGPDPGVPAQAFSELESRFDSVRGGFGGAPKFPSPHQFLFLLRHHHRTGNEKALGMVGKTLSAMRLGGIWDHVGYGFHRYATDREWLVPHFEKMLYDQALIAIAYLEAYQITRRSEFARTAREIFSYVLRDMTSPEGAFFSAEDADSEGEEGKFYVWTTPEFREALGEEKADRWEKIMNVEASGNFADEATGRKTGANILHLKEPLEKWAGKIGISEDGLIQEWEAIRSRLYEKRALRIPPLKDDKILTDWNGLMIAALSLGARVLAAPEYARAAQRGAAFLLGTMRDASGRLLHRYREGEAAISATANDYAFLIMGLIELYQVTYDPPHLENAVLLQERMTMDFRNPESGWFYMTPDGSTELPVRPVELQDGALPSANSVSLVNLLRLSRLTGETKWETGANDIIKAFSGTVGQHPSAYTYFLLGIDFVLNPGEEIVISGDPAASDTQELLSALNLHFSPGRVSLVKSEENAGKLAEISNFTAGLDRLHGKATAHICKGFSCKEPTTDLEEFIRKIGSYK